MAYYSQIKKNNNEAIFHGDYYLLHLHSIFDRCIINYLVAQTILIRWMLERFSTHRPASVFLELDVILEGHTQRERIDRLVWQGLERPAKACTECIQTPSC